MHNRSIVNELKSFFLDKKNAAALLFLTLMVVILPVGVALIRQQQIFNSRASGEFIKIGTGRCVQEKDGKKVLICNEVPLEITAPYNPNVTPTPSGTTSSPTPTPTPVPAGANTLLNGLVLALELGEQVTQPVATATVSAQLTGTTVVEGHVGGKARDFTHNGGLTVSGLTLNNTSFTIAALINLRPTATANLGTIFSSDGAVFTAYSVDQDRNVSCNMLNTSHGDVGIATGPLGIFMPNQWRLAVCKVENRVVDTSFDAQHGTTATIAQNVTLGAHTNIKIGTNPTNSFPGYIQRVLAWNRALTNAEISQLSSAYGKIAMQSEEVKIAEKNRGLMSKISSAIVPEAVAYDKHRCEGDTTPGVGGLIDIVVNGCGEILNYSSIFNSCVPSATVQYKPPVWDAAINQWKTVKQDGTVISQAEMIQKSERDGRFPISLSSTTDPYINCEVYFEYSGRNDCDVTPQQNASGQAMGREGTELAPGQTFTMAVQKTANPASGDPDCKQQVQVELAKASTSPTASPSPTVSPTPSPSGNQCTAGTFSGAVMELPNVCGTITNQPSAGVSVGTIMYTAPNITSDAVCTMRVSTGNNGDCRLDAGTKGSINNPIKPNESISVNYTNACVDSTAGCSLPLYISSAAALPTDKVAYKLAESETALSSATERGYTNTTFTTTYALVDQKPGMKTIYVEFIDKRTNQKKTDFVPIELIEQKPVITSASCSYDIQSKKVSVTAKGLRFGTDKGALPIDNPLRIPDITKWTETEVVGSFSVAEGTTTPTDDLKFRVITKDDRKSDDVSCTFGLNTVSLGTQLICRGMGKMNLDKVNIMITDEQGKKAEEVASISAEGLISNLKTKLEIGKNYTISIKAPGILRRNVTFTAKEGTTVITKEDGTKLQLPVGDIYPVSSGGDGQINALDQAELKRQWRTSEATGAAVLTADFNLDKRVNSFDWSCMRKDFGSSDDPLGTTPPSGPTSVNFNNSGTSQNPISVQFGTPESNPNVMPDPDVTTPPSQPRQVIEFQ